jgi:hypothetical protein
MSSTITNYLINLPGIEPRSCSQYPVPVTEITSSNKILSFFHGPPILTTYLMRSILMLFSHLILDLTSGLFPRCSPPTFRRHSFLHHPVLHPTVFVRADANNHPCPPALRYTRASNVTTSCEKVSLPANCGRTHSFVAGFRDILFHLN